MLSGYSNFPKTLQQLFFIIAFYKFSQFFNCEISITILDSPTQGHADQIELEFLFTNPLNEFKSFYSHSSHQSLGFKAIFPSRCILWYRTLLSDKNQRHSIIFKIQTEIIYAQSQTYQKINTLTPVMYVQNIASVQKQVNKYSKKFIN